MSSPEVGYASDEQGPDFECAACSNGQIRPLPRAESLSPLGAMKMEGEAVASRGARAEATGVPKGESRNWRLQGVAKVQSQRLARGPGTASNARGGGARGTEPRRTQWGVGGVGFCRGDAGLRESPRWPVRDSTSENSLMESFPAGETTDGQARVFLGAGNEIKKVQDLLILDLNDIEHGILQSW